tara:strand:+ start:9524 stop:10204 length:681 start_codon:yes stop_codon:yes gene_type:complete
VLKEIISLIYPHVCLSCAEPLRKYDQNICLKCKSHLPKTKFSQRIENPVVKLLWGKAHIEHASSAFYFKKGNRIQKLMHQLKYKGKKELGEELGALMARELKCSTIYNKIDAIIPLPLHKSKLRLRGYNQCDPIAKGLSEQLRVDVLNHSVKRKHANTSQTNKGHYERHKNVENIFEVCNPKELNGRNILLIDDVITTGSTIAACARAINKISSAKVYVSTLAAVI